LWIVITLFGVVAVLVLLLCVPLELAFQAEVLGKPRTRFRLLWFFGLVGREMTGRRERKEKAASEKPAKVKKKKKHFKDAFVVLRTRGLLKQFLVFIGDLLRCMKIKDLDTDIRVGLGSPDDTGLLFAFAGPPVALLGSSVPCSIKIRPAFEDQVTFEGHARGKIRLRPILLFPPALKFLFSLATFRLVKNFVVSRWKRRRK
jgi:hypothetical protein